MFQTSAYEIGRETRWAPSASMYTYLRVTYVILRDRLLVNTYNRTGLSPDPILIFTDRRYYLRLFHLYAYV